MVPSGMDDNGIGLNLPEQTHTHTNPIADATRDNLKRIYDNNITYMHTHTQTHTHNDIRTMDYVRTQRKLQIKRTPKQNQ